MCRCTWELEMKYCFPVQVSLRLCSLGVSQARLNSKSILPLQWLFLRTNFKIKVRWSIAMSLSHSKCSLSVGVGVWGWSSQPSQPSRHTGCSSMRKGQLQNKSETSKTVQQGSPTSDARGPRSTMFWMSLSSNTPASTVRRNISWDESGRCCKKIVD